jgi:hypothetical protein
VDELAPLTVEWRYGYFTAMASFDHVETRSPVARVRSFVEQQIKPATSSGMIHFKSGAVPRSDCPALHPHQVS